LSAETSASDQSFGSHEVNDTTSNNPTYLLRDTKDQFDSSRDILQPTQHDVVLELPAHEIGDLGGIADASESTAQALTPSTASRPFLGNPEIEPLPLGQQFGVSQSLPGSLGYLSNRRIARSSSLSTPSSRQTIDFTKMSE
jgi:hypothetical protein